MDKMDDTVVESKFGTLPVDVQMKVFGRLKLQDILNARLVSSTWCVIISFTYKPKWSLTKYKPGSLEALKCCSFRQLGTMSISDFHGKLKLPISSSTRKKIPRARCLIIGVNNSVENLKLLLRYYMDKLARLEFDGLCLAPLQLNEIKMKNLKFTQLREISIKIFIAASNAITMTVNGVEAQISNFYEHKLQIANHMKNLNALLKQVYIPFLKKIDFDLIFYLGQDILVPFANREIDKFREAFQIFLKTHAILIKTFGISLESDCPRLIISMLDDLKPLTNYVEELILRVISLEFSPSELPQNQQFEALKTFRNVKDFTVETNIRPIIKIFNYYKTTVRRLVLRFYDDFSASPNILLLDSTVFPKLKDLAVTGKLFNSTQSVETTTGLSLITDLHLIMGWIFSDGDEISKPLIVAAIINKMPHLKTLIWTWTNYYKYDIRTAKDVLILDELKELVIKLTKLQAITIEYNNIKRTAHLMPEDTENLFIDIENWCQQTVGVHGNLTSPSIFNIFVDRKTYSQQLL